MLFRIIVRDSRPDPDEMNSADIERVKEAASAIDTRRVVEIARVCKERSIWFHVDGAYGGVAAAVPDVSDDLRALSLAESVAVDPHKWLYAPLEAGCALVRDAAALRAAFS